MKYILSFQNIRFNMQKNIFYKNESRILYSGSNFWKITNRSIADGYPKSISSSWPGLPDDIDAAFTWPDHGYTYFFKGT